MAFIKCKKYLDANLISIATSSRANLRLFPWGKKKELDNEELQSVIVQDEHQKRTMNAFYDSQQEMDSIRARGFLKYRHRYNPPKNVDSIIKETISKHGLKVQEDWKAQTLNLNVKEKILLEIGEELMLFVPNSQLHKLKTVGDLLEYYSTPISNLPKYAEMARDESLPENLAIREHPVRFHPNDVEAPHGGITAFPGSGGQVFGLRNKRIYRQFNPKKEWYEFEEQNFNYERVDKYMPWDPEMAQKMDRYIDKKFSINSLKWKKI